LKVVKDRKTKGHRQSRYGQENQKA